MSLDAFTTSLEQSLAQHPPAKARRIAALLPQIEAAMAQGSPRSHIVTALRGIGIDITPHQLSNVIARLRRQKPVLNANTGPKADADSSAAPSPLAQITSVPTLAPAPNASSASRYGAHDPRLLDEVMRSTPDMKALAKLAPKPTPQGTP